MPRAYLLLLGLLAMPCQADSLRCNGRLISSGDLSSDVLGRCGEPNNRSFLGNKIITGDWGERYEVAVEEWFYGPWNGMLYFVRFEGNRLSSIQSKRSN